MNIEAAVDDGLLLVAVPIESKLHVRFLAPA